MIKKYILIIGFLAQFVTEIKLYSNTPSLMEKTYHTCRYVKNVSKKYGPKIMKALLYIGIPTVLTGSTLLYVACKKNRQNTTPFWQTCQDKTKLQLDEIKKSTEKFIEQHGPEIKENIHAAGTNVIKGLVYINKEIALMVKDALIQA